MSHVEPPNNNPTLGAATVTSDCITPGFHLASTERQDGRWLHLYSEQSRSYRVHPGLTSSEAEGNHLRWHPFREDWVCHATGRQQRTFLPSESECPLCPMPSEHAAPTDVPVSDYEIAIFTNRFSALALKGSSIQPRNKSIKPALGVCEVISYCADHSGSIATLSDHRVHLLTQAIGHRITQLYKHDAVQWVLPFENRGEPIGVTLSHPHGQLYGFSEIPAETKRQMEVMRKERPLDAVDRNVPTGLRVAENDTALAFVPEWARYPYEVWIVPKTPVALPDDLSASDGRRFSLLLKEVVRRLDAIFDAPMPYTLGWQIGPKSGVDYAMHVIIQPLQRAPHKMKYLAAIEQFTGMFLLDLSPEDSAQALREVEV